MAEHAAAQAGHEEHETHGSGALYFGVFIALCILTATSVAAYYLTKDTPKVGWSVMMAVSCLKATLVIMFFMHLKWEASWKYVLTFPAMVMSAFLILMLVPDIGMRGENLSRERRLHMATPVKYDRAHHMRHESHGADEGEHEADPGEH